jgi:isocitrate/isopropylmalate dehydrogenase
MTMGVEENVKKKKKKYGCIKICFGKNMRKYANLRMHKVIEKSALEYGTETWVIREEKRRTEPSVSALSRGLVLG